LNKTGDSVGSRLSNTVLQTFNLLLAADFAGLLILDNNHHIMEKAMNEATWKKNNFKRGNLRPTSASPRNMNEKLDKVIDLSQNLENKLNGIQTKTVEHENKLNQIEEKKVQLYNEMVQKRNLILFQRDRQKQYIRKENILIYGVEEGQEDDDDGEKILFTVADELEIYLQPNDIQRLGQKKRETGRSTHNHCKGLCHTKKETSFLLTNRISVVFKADSMFS